MSERKLEDNELENISGGDQEFQRTEGDGGESKVLRVKLPHDTGGEESGPETVPGG